ncbi:hypothetical protein [Candidatus Tisiphia endosymbiont of Hybos culiciformis]
MICPYHLFQLLSSHQALGIVMPIGLGDKEHNDCKLSFLAAAGI